MALERRFHANGAESERTVAHRTEVATPKVEREHRLSEVDSNVRKNTVGDADGNRRGSHRRAHFEELRLQPGWWAAGAAEAHGADQRDRRHLRLPRVRSIDVCKENSWQRRSLALAMELAHGRLIGVAIPARVDQVTLHDASPADLLAHQERQSGLCARMLHERGRSAPAT